MGAELRETCVRSKPEDNKVPLCFTGLHERVQSALAKEDDVIDDYAELENMFKEQGFQEDAQIVDEIRNDEIDHTRKFTVLLGRHSNSSNPGLSTPETVSNRPMGLFERWLQDKGINLKYFEEDMSQLGKNAMYATFKAEQAREWKKTIPPVVSSTPPASSSVSSNPVKFFSPERLKKWKEPEDYTVTLDKGLPRELTVTVSAMHKPEAAWKARQKFTEVRGVLPQTMQFESPP